MVTILTIFVQNDQIKRYISSLNKLFSFIILKFKQQKCITTQHVLKIHVKTNKVFCRELKNVNCSKELHKISI